MLVMFEHIFMQILLHGKVEGVAADVMDWLANSYFSLGRFGVVVFFMISGFVIPYSLRSGGERPVEKFIVGRIFRLYPAYWVSLILALLALGFFGERVGLAQAIANFTMVQSLLGQEHIMGIYWTLFVELVFYGMCVVLFLAKLIKKPVVSAVVSTFLVLAMLYKNFSVSSNTYIPPGGIAFALALMFLGALVRSALHDRDRLARLLLPAICFVVLGAKALLLYRYQGTPTFKVLLPEFTAEILAVAIFVTCSQLKPAGTGFLKYMGLISYSIYLFHGVVFTVTSHLFYRNSSVIGDFGFLICTVILTFAASSLSYRFVERPGIALGRKMQRIVSPR